MHMRPALAGLLAIPVLMAADTPTPPPGWIEYSAKDRSFSAWLPQKSNRKNEREGTATVSGLRIKFSLVHVEVKSLTYEASTLLLPARSVRPLSTKEKLEIIREVFLNEIRGKVTEETDIEKDRVKGKEYRIQAGRSLARLRAFARGGRLYRASVFGSKSQVDSKNADTFLESFQPSAKAPDGAASKSADKGKEKADASSKADASDLKWVADAGKMTIPDAPVAGKLLGEDFQPNKIEFNSVAKTLSLEKGRGDADIKIFLFLKAGEQLEEKSYKINAPGRLGEQRPQVHAGSKSAGRKSWTNGYALRLEFGKAKDGMIPGKIYLCLPDENKSVVAGTFSMKRP